MKDLWRVLRALVFAVRGHRGQRDKAGAAYWRHLVRVAWIAAGIAPAGMRAEAAVVGLLHDYIEDVLPFSGLNELAPRFGITTAVRVQILSREIGEAYAVYIVRVVKSDDAVCVAVKVADLLHNTMPGRATIAAQKRREYAAALSTLTFVRAGLEVWDI